MISRSRCFTSSLHSLRAFSASFCTSKESSLFIEKPHAGIAVLSLNRDVGKNSFSKKFLEEFVSATNTLRDDASINVLILKSSIPKVFCSGADLKERIAMPDNQVSGFVAQLRNAFTAFAHLPFPTIAAIEGIAFGGGLELALCADMRIAGENATLGLTETALAIIPGAGGSQRLPRLVGISKAKELIYTAKRLTAAEAATIGLINEQVPAGSAVDRALEIARKMNMNGPLALRAAKSAIDNGMQTSLEIGLSTEKTCYDSVIYTEDRKEGLKAFVEKRSPNYTGK